MLEGEAKKYQNRFEALHPTEIAIAKQEGYLEGGIMGALQIIRKDFLKGSEPNFLSVMIQFALEDELEGEDREELHDLVEFCRIYSSLSGRKVCKHVLEEPCFVLDPAGERLQNRHPDQISSVKTSFLEESEFLHVGDFGLFYGDIYSRGVIEQVDAELEELRKGKEPKDA